MIGLLLGGCIKKPKPEPGPEPEPEPEPNPEDKWKDYFPANWYIPFADWWNNWRKRDFESAEWQAYEQEVDRLFKLTERPVLDDYALARILVTKLPDGRYFFKWTSDMDVWGLADHWSTPAEFLYCRKDEKGNCDPDGLYRDDCDGFAGLHCDILYRMIGYPLVWFMEIYWQRKKNDVWVSYGHAITVYKREMEGNFRVFSNQSWVGMTNGYARPEDIIFVFVPINSPLQKDNYRLLYAKARHPLTGKLLWLLKGEDISYD